MDVIAGGGAHVRQARPLAGPFGGGDGGGGSGGAGEILFGGELHVAGLALEQRHGHAGPFGKRGIVGEIVPSGKEGAAVGREQAVIGEGLRRLDGAQAAAIDSADDKAMRIHRLDGVGERQSRNGGAAFARRDGAGHQGRGGERPRRIMHQHDARRFLLQRLQAGAYRTLARRAAIGWRAQFQPGAGFGKARRIVAMDHRLHKIDLQMASEQRQRMPDHRHAGQQAILLGCAGPGARSPTGRDYDRRHPARHLCHPLRSCSADLGQHAED